MLGVVLLTFAFNCHLKVEFKGQTDYLGLIVDGFFCTDVWMGSLTYWVIPENTLALHVRAVYVCLDTNPRLVVYTFAPDIDQRLE